MIYNFIFNPAENPMELGQVLTAASLLIELKAILTVGIIVKESLSVSLYDCTNTSQTVKVNRQSVTVQFSVSFIEFIKK